MKRQVMMTDTEIPHQELTYKIIGAGMKVHSRLGPGLKEEHYQRLLASELRDLDIHVTEEYCLDINDNQVWLGRLYLDLLVNEAVVAEIKSLPHLLTNEEPGQVISYLAATGYKGGLLLNFGRSRLQYKRILPPLVVQGWQQRIGRFLWRPDDLISPPNEHG